MSATIPIISITTITTIISVNTIMTMITISTILPATIHPSYLARVLMYCFTVDRGIRVVKAKSSILPLSVPPLCSAQCSEVQFSLKVPYTLYSAVYSAVCSAVF